MSTPGHEPQWEVGYACEFAKAAAFWDPLGMNPRSREELAKGCSALRTAKGKIAGGGESRVLHLCYAHFSIFNAVPST